MAARSCTYPRKTNILIYPFGADISDWQPYSAENQKFAYLKSQGFDIFCNVDASTPAWGQLGTDFYRNARINIDGIRFQSDLDGKILFLIHSSMSMMSMTKKHANLLDFTSFMNQKAELTFYRQFRLLCFISSSVRFP